MKKFILVLCLLSLTVQVFSQNVYTVRELSDERIEHEKEIFAKGESKRQIAKDAIYYSALGISTYYVASSIHDWLYPNDEQPNQQVNTLVEKLKELTPEQIERLKESLIAKSVVDKKAEEVAEVSSTDPTWKKAVKYGTKKSISWSKSICSSFAYHMVSAIVIQTLSSQVLKPVSKFNDQYFGDRSIGWFVEQKTTLKTIVKNLMHSLRSKTKKRISKDELCSKIDMLVAQFEKILGYISFTLEKNEMQKHEIEFKRSTVLIKKIKESLQKLINKVNTKFLETDSEKIRKSELKATKIHKYLEYLVDQCQFFNEIEESIGLGDFEERTIFDDLRILINPELAESEIPNNELLEVIKSLGK